MEKQLEFAWHSGIFLVTCLGLFVLARWVFKLFNNKLNITGELVDKDNTSFFIAYFCYFAGIIAIIGGVMNSEGVGDLWTEIVYTIIYGVIGIIVLNIITLLSDKFVHTKVKLWNEVEEGNIAIGVLKGSNYLSTGIIIAGVIQTEVDKPLEAWIFLVFAMLIASLGFFYYNLMAPFDAKNEIYSGNYAVALSAAGAQVAFALLIHAGFLIEHTTWMDSLVGIGIDVLGGLILLPVIRLIVDKVFIPRRKITDELINQEIPNAGLGMFEAVAYISGALLFIWCWNL